VPCRIGSRADARLSPADVGTIAPMIFITAKFRVQPADADNWPSITHEFTTATRAEPGCLWFDWSRSVDDPTEYVLVEAFADDDAASAHVTSSHFKTAQQTLPPHLVETPKIVNFKLDQNNWSELGELAVNR
jgi:quinol monooxygenase YgiN